MKYTHLYNRIADTYFTRRDERPQQSGVSKDASKNKSLFFIGVGISSLIILLVALFAFGNVFNKSATVSAQKKSLSVLGNILPLRLDYEFAQTSEKIKSITLDLPQINLADYDVLEFALRGDPQKGFSNLIKVGLESSRKEKKSIYVRGIDSRWKTFKIPLQLSSLNSFSDLSGISFTVEGWNIEEEEGRIFIDKIRFSKKE